MAGRAWRRAALLVGPPALLCGLFLLADALAPLPLERLHAPYATLVVDRHGDPLRVFPDAQGTWRYAVSTEQVSPRYLEALIQYEDRWFYQHPGVNPLALIRALWQNLHHGQVISGGSTLTMQVARLLDPHARTVPGKLKQMFRALQLEWHLDKTAILTLYLNHAPFGGTVEGVQAASLTYLGKPAERLTHAEAALLAVLPQAPSYLRPDLHPQRAQAARDKVLRRLARYGVWDAATLASARQEPVEPYYRLHPFLAPLLARRLRLEAPEAGIIRTTLEPHLQRELEAYLRSYAAQLPAASSVAALVVENDSMAVRAYAGSADFFSRARLGQVDMVRARRSPGSTLKPFLYGFALDDGLIHSESLLADTPGSFDGYRPANFSGGFSGPVSAASALQRSLNVPAVDLLKRIGPANFDARLANGGLKLAYPPGAGPSLAMILGGVGSDLESLVGAYAALGRGGLAAVPRYRPDEPLRERRMLSQGSAWIVREMLRTGPRPGLPGGEWLLPPERVIAWKTGTSYGFRDAWSLGVSERYTVGVWVGRPDGTPLPGHYGARTAAPALFAIMEMLPRASHLQADGGVVPDSVSRHTICWPLGQAPEAGHPELCQVEREAWTLAGVVPPTLPDRYGRESLAARVEYWINPANGRRISADCGISERQPRVLARWPLALTKWLPPAWRDKSRLPPLDPRCDPTGAGGLSPPLRLVGMDETLRLLPAGADGEAPLVTFEAVGGEGRLYWLVDGELQGSTATPAQFRVRFPEPGRYSLTVIDGNGSHDSVAVELLRSPAKAAEHAEGERTRS